MEDAMFKYFAICAGLLALIGGPVKAQQAATAPQNAEVPGAIGNIVVVLAKSAMDTIVDLRGQPDPLFGYMVGSERSRATDRGKTIQESGSRQISIQGFYVNPGSGKSP
jgi:hypothetical protein